MGMKKITKKWCWLAKETKLGWKLTLEIGNTTFKAVDKENKTKFIKTMKGVESFANSFLPSEGKIVFIHLSKCNCKIK